MILAQELDEVVTRAMRVTRRTRVYRGGGMMRFSGATVLAQWATGGLFFLWITTRRRLLGIGYGWLLRATCLLMALGAVAAGLASSTVALREIATAAMAVAAGVALVVSWQRRRAGVAGQRDESERRSARVAAMTGIDRAPQQFDRAEAEFPPTLDLIPPLIGVVGLIAAGVDAGDPALLGVARTLVGAGFLGAVTDAMLLGHWYLVQPGLSREPLREMTAWVGALWAPELVVMLWPTGMMSALTGSIDDGYNGLLGWFWVACVVTTIGLVIVTRLALREKQYSAVMAATGLLYLAILTAFGMDLVARAILS